MRWSPGFQSATSDPFSRTIGSPRYASRASLVQVRPIGAPWNSMRPPQETIAGQVSGSIPSKCFSRIVAVFPAGMGSPGRPTSNAGRGSPVRGAGPWKSQSNPFSDASSPGWTLISPTSSRVSRSRANSRVPATCTERIGTSELRS